MLSALDSLSGPLWIYCSRPAQDPDALGRLRIATHTRCHSRPLTLTDGELSMDPPELEEDVA